jgi:two-component system phosphate regulon response regulator OmpR
MSQFLVVVVEDESNLRSAVVEYLKLYNYDAIGAADGQEMRAIVAERQPDAVILDISLPGEDGLSLCRALRRDHRLGIIMATAAGQPLDRVVGLEIGADDYLVKPYELRELLARLRSVLRRSQHEAAAPAPVTKPSPALADAIRFGGFTLSNAGRRVTDTEGREVTLTAMEFDLLRVLAERPGRPLSREMLSQLAHGRPLADDDRSIDVRITRLRKKFEQDPGKPQLIRTIRGEGYQFDPDAA